MSLLELILKTKVSWDHFQHMHVWGCPCYVLEPTLQDGYKLPKWNHISSWAIFLGFLSCHSSHVPLVLNLDTGHVSPQFHMVFDDWLTRVILATVSKSFNLTQWMELFADSHPHYTLDDNDPVILADEWVVDHETHVDHFAKIDAAQGCGPYLQREKRPQTEGDAHLIFDFVLPFSAPPPPHLVDWWIMAWKTIFPSLSHCLLWILCCQILQQNLLQQNLLLPILLP